MKLEKIGENAIGGIVTAVVVAVAGIVWASGQAMAGALVPAWTLIAMGCVIVLCAGVAFLGGKQKAEKIAKLQASLQEGEKQTAALKTEIGDLKEKLYPSSLDLLEVKILYRIATTDYNAVHEIAHFEKVNVARAAYGIGELARLKYAVEVSAPTRQPDAKHKRWIATQEGLALLKRNGRIS